MAEILVVDDELPIQRLVRLVLAPHGHNVRGVSTGGDALDSVERNPTDLILLDLGLPDIDGREVFRRLRDKGVQTPVLIVSAGDALGARQRLGAEAAITKPFEPQELSEKVDEVLMHATASSLTQRQAVSGRRGSIFALRARRP